MAWARSPDPAVQVILDALEKNPELWDLTSVPLYSTHYEWCEKNDDRAEATTRADYTTQYREMRAWRRLIFIRNEFVLTYSDKVIQLKDSYPESPHGWTVVLPEHTVVNRVDRYRLDLAVQRWRVWRLAENAKAATPEGKLLAESQASVTKLLTTGQQ
jgi:hypothetical protein